MKFLKATLPLLLVLLLVFSCSKVQDVSVADEKSQILKLHNAQREYHFNKDSIAFTDQLSDNFISVTNGKISRPKKEETLARYNNYFSSVEFLKWDDVTEPIIKFSDDGSMAYAIVDKIVEVTYKDGNGTTKKEKTYFAWTAIYKKYGDAWKIDCVTSTNKPSNTITSEN